MEEKENLANFTETKKSRNIGTSYKNVKGENT